MELHGVQCRGMTTATTIVGQQVTPGTFYIVEGVEIGIFGLDALAKLQTKIDTTTGQLVIGDEVIVGSRKNVSPSNIQMTVCRNLRLTESVTERPDHECFLTAVTSKGDVPTWGGIVEATKRFMEQTAWLIDFCSSSRTWADISSGENVPSLTRPF